MNSKPLSKYHFKKLIPFHKKKEKGCESGFPYCFLTDFTEFFL